MGIANRIFEMYLLNLFASKESVGSEIFLCGQEDKEETADMCRAMVEIQKDAERKGERKGMDRLGKLTRLLLADNRQDDLIRSTTDRAFMQKLFKEYEV